VVAVRSLLARVGRLEHADTPPILAKFGGKAGWAAFEAETQAGITEGRYDSLDMPIVVNALRRWLTL
jgi:hypothetical protein